MVRHCQPAVWNRVVIIDQLCRYRGTAIPGETREYQGVAVGGRFVRLGVRRGVITDGVRLTRVSITETTKLKTIAGGIIDHHIVGDGGGTRGYRPARVADSNGVIDRQIAATGGVGDRGTRLGFGDGEIGRPDRRGGSGDGHALAPK